MFGKLYKSVATTAIASLSIATVMATPVMATPAMAADIPLSSPVETMAQSGDWMALAEGEEHWYAMHYDYISDDGKITSEAIVEIEMGTENSISFEVYTLAQAQEWANGDDVDPIGMGSLKSDLTGNKNHDTKLVWANRTAASETFYIVVQNGRNAESYYELNINGTGISFPDATINSTSAIAATKTSEPPEIAEAQPEMPNMTVDDGGSALVAAGGYGPAEATAPVNGKVMLSPGETAWYMFDYDYDGTGDPTQALLELKMDIDDSINVEIWTPEQVRKWTNGQSFDPIGAGSVMNQGLSDEDTNMLVWAGGQRASIKYYVLVENNTQLPAAYTLSINGLDVSF